MNVNVKIKKLHSVAVIPQYAKPGDAGLDLTAISKKYDNHGNVMYGTGLAVEIPEGYVGLLFPRSSITKHDLTLTNSVGVIDSGYRGEIFVKFKPALCYTSLSNDTDYFENISVPDPVTMDHNEYNMGDKIAQLIIMPYPKVTFEEVEELSTTERGEGGFGSTGK